MRIDKLVRIIPPAGLFALVCVGCQPSAPEKPKRPAVEVGEEGPSPRKSPARPAAKIEEPPPKPTIPHVRLSSTQLATCHVKVGDNMPDAELPDLQANTTAVRSLYGSKLTVICFWTAGNSKYTEAAALDLLEDLQKDFFGPYAEKGLGIVGVNVGEAPDAVAATVSRAGTKFPMLLDPQSQFFSKVATEKTPRVYLLDASGKILWFDVEYSRSTRRDLLQAIQVALGEI